MSSTDINKPPWYFFSLKTAPRCRTTRNLIRWIKADQLVEQTINNTPSELCEAKNKIETCGPQYLWDYAKKITNPYELVYTFKKHNIPKSLSIIQPLSRSYYKMIEILNLTDFYNYRSSKTSLRTAHVCEGPGGFIEAIYDAANRTSATNKLAVASTHAMTLRSTQAHIPGWRKAQRFLQKNKQIKIEYGVDGTGNILLKENRDYFINSVRQQNPTGINIFTADGGFDFTSNYLEQEAIIFPLLLASIHIGFSVLGTNGLFVLKLFDYFETATLQLIEFMACQFDKWTIYKPATSRPCNSEQYFIGVGFRQMIPSAFLEFDSTFNKLIDFGKMTTCIYESDESAAVQDQIIKIRETMMNRQIKFLKEAQSYVIKWNNSEPTSEELLYLWNKSYENSLIFCRKFRVYFSNPINASRASCELVLPTNASGAYKVKCITDCEDSSSSVAEMGEIVQEENVQPDEFPQSSTPDAGSSFLGPSDPTYEALNVIVKDPHPQATS
jgi:23S rRNA U2552 (ribose-2'-O)-methylase RlmE/FtsJ